MTKFSDRLRTAHKKQPAKKEPLWKGPEEDGITFSLLSRFLCCRERFRLMVMEGLVTDEGFNHRLGYGNMWHLCEEHKAKDPTNRRNERPWEGPLKEYAKQLCRDYPMQQADIDHWYNVCRIQFPIYVEYWKRHAQKQKQTPILQEYTFRVPYQLPSGRTVSLRGKWDSVDVERISNRQEIWLQENKTKGDIVEQQIKRQLKFDLQTMIYLVALHEWRHPDNRESIAGVRYNVVRRPLSGGKGTIVRHKARGSKPEETKAHYYERVRKVIDGTGEDAPGPEHFFMRWECRVTPGDIQKFQRECLDPILEQLCDWWEWVCEGGTPWGSKSMRIQNVDHLVQMPNAMHWRHPFGVYNVLDEGGSSDLDEYLETGSTVGLVRTGNLFPELT